MRLWQPVTALNFSEFAAFSLADVQGKNNAYIYLCSSHHPPHTTPRLLTFVWWFSTKDNCAFPRASWQCHSVLSAIIRLVVLYKSAQKSPMEKSNSSLSLSLCFSALSCIFGVCRGGKTSTTSVFASNLHAMGNKKRVSSIQFSSKILHSSALHFACVRFGSFLLGFGFDIDSGFGHARLIWPSWKISQENLHTKSVRDGTLNTTVVSAHLVSVLLFAVVAVFVVYLSRCIKSSN